MANNQSKTNIWIDGSQAGATLTQLKKSVNALNREIKDLPRNSDAYKKKMMELKDANGALSQHRAQIKGVGDSYGKAQSGLGGMLKQFAPMAGLVGVATIAIDGISTAVSSWYKNNVEMEKSLSSLRALTGASTEDIQFYKEAAQEMGRTSTMSAIQTVEAFKLIGSARPELLKDKEALAAVTKETITLAEASEMDMATSAQAMAGAMNQFNLSADQSSRIINTFAAGSKEGAAEVDDLTQSIDKFGTVASANNVTLEESVALTELMSEKNIKGSEAGTQLRNVLLNISTAASLSKEAQDAMAQYGVNLEIVQNKALPLETRLREMAKVQGDQNALVKIFGKENVVAGATVLKNVDHLSELTKAVTGTNTAYDQAAINTDNLDGDLKRLGASWEGLTLSMDGGSNIFRPIVQAGTDFLNWTTDSITALKEWDTQKMETQLLKLVNAIPLVNSLFGEFLDYQIRVNEIASKVAAEMRVEVEANTVLTSSLMANNQALKSNNVSQAEKIKISEENDKIIAKLNEKYPELTKNIDFNKISTDEMNKLQKEMNDTMLEQSINAAKAAEQERLLNEIINNTIKSQQEKLDIQKSAATYNGGLLQTIGLIKDLSDLNDADKTVKSSQKQLNRLGDTFKEIEKQVKGMDLNIGSKFQLETDKSKLAAAEIKKISAELDKVTDPQKRKGLQAQLKALQGSISESSKKQQQQLDNLINKTNEQIAQDEVLAQKRQENAKKAADNYKRLKESLDSLIETSKKFKDDLDYTKKFDAFTDEQQKELFALEHSINEKYEKEIKAAQDLAKQKGTIGAKAQEQLNLLLATKEQDLEHEKAKINEKYRKQKQDADYEAAKQANLNAIKQQESLEKAMMDLKVLKATASVEAVSKADIEARKAAEAELKKVIIEQAEYEKKVKLDALRDQYADDVISKEEFDLRKEELEIQHRTKIEEINATSDEKIHQMTLERMDESLNKLSEAIDIISQFYDAAYQNRINSIEKEKSAELKSLEEQYKKGIISKDAYEQQKLEIESGADEQRKAIENDKAKKDKEVALAQAVIQAALGVLKASPNVPLMALAGLAGAAQIALIASQEVPQYAEGGYHNVVGATDGKNYNAKFIGRHQGGMLPASPSLALVSEQGPEYFVPYHLMQNQVVADSVGVIEAIRTNQFANGGFTQASASSMSDNKLVQMLNMNIQMMAALSRQIPNMYARIDDGTIEDLQTRIDEINQFRN